MKIGILGTGKFALSIAYLLEKNNIDLTFIGRDEKQLLDLENNKRNSKYSNHSFNLNISVLMLNKYNQNIKNAKFDLLFYCLPSSCLDNFTDIDIPIIFTSKGFNGKYIHQMYKNYGMLAGGSYAQEILNDIPCYLTIASKNTNLIKLVTKILKSDYCFLSESNFPKSIEILGIFKNILAIFCGIINELKMGKNIEGAFITKIIKRLSELGEFKEKCLSEPAGLGDLFLSCSSNQSRNYSFGKNLIKDPSNVNLKILVEGYYALTNMNNYLDSKLIKTLFNIINNIILYKTPHQDIKNHIVDILKN